MVRPFPSSFHRRTGPPRKDGVPGLLPAGEEVRTLTSVMLGRIGICPGAGVLPYAPTGRRLAAVRHGSHRLFSMIGHPEPMLRPSADHRHERSTGAVAHQAGLSVSAVRAPGAGALPGRRGAVANLEPVGPAMKVVVAGPYG